MYDFGPVHRAFFRHLWDECLSRSRESRVSQPPAPGPEPGIQQSGSKRTTLDMSPELKSSQGQSLCEISVCAVLLPINSGNGNGLAIEAHPLIVAQADLVCRCRPRQDKLESKRHIT